MKIAVLGANGFVGQHLVKYLSAEYTVIPIVRSTVNLLNYQQVKEFLEYHKFDSIVNAATSHTDDSVLTDTLVNLGMFMNFYHCANLFGQYINLASGAEFDRSVDINQANEVDIFQRLPKDSYGFGHNIISRLCHDRDNFDTLRIFGCFGSNEKPTRLIPRILSSTEHFHIHNDRYFDYISIDDFCLIVNCIIQQRPKNKDTNCVYQNKIKLSEFAKTFIEAHRLKIELTVESCDRLNYTGSSNHIKMLGIELKGIEHGIQNYFNR